MRCFKNQGPTCAESQWRCKMEGGKDLFLHNFEFYLDFYYCTIWNFYIHILEKMVCHVTSLTKPLLPYKSYNYLVMTPGSIKMKDLAHSTGDFPQDTRETLLLIHRIFICQEKVVSLPNRSLPTCCRRQKAAQKNGSSELRFLGSESYSLFKHLTSGGHERHTQEEKNHMQNHWI